MFVIILLIILLFLFSNDLTVMYPSNYSKFIFIIIVTLLIYNGFKLYLIFILFIFFAFNFGTSKEIFKKKYQKFLKYCSEKKKQINDKKSKLKLKSILKNQ